MSIIFSLIVAIAQSFNRIQSAKVRELMNLYDVDKFSAIIDTPMRNNIAYTDMLDKNIYIDGWRMIDTPRTFQNVFHHESDHLKGREHNNISGDIMSYSVQVDARGSIIDDDHVWD